MYNPMELKVGDTVQVRAHTVTTLYGMKVDGYTSGKTAVILGLTKDYSWRSEPNKAQLRYIEGDNERAWVDSEPLERLLLVTRGPGRVELGVTHPWTQAELREQRWAEFVQKVNNASLTYEGFSNPATFLTWILLKQEPRTQAELQRLVRKDRTLNPSRVRKLFSSKRLRIEDWAFECPIDVPAEFSSRGNPAAQRQEVNWAEVAATFATQFAEGSA